MNLKYVKREVEKIISKRFLPDITIKEDDILTECGMDSVEMIQLVIELETHFEFEFEDEKLSYETLRSINTIVSYIYMRLGEH